MLGEVFGEERTKAPGQWDGGEGRHSSLSSWMEISFPKTGGQKSLKSSLCKSRGFAENYAGFEGPRSALGEGMWAGL